MHYVFFREILEVQLNENREYLYDELIRYAATDSYPFHMPGHKRRLGAMADPFSFDITEIDGFDNLHHAEGILKAAQERAARLYGSEKTWYLINGSTAGILAAVSACAAAYREKKGTGGGRLLMARNCHKAAYHAVYLNRLKAEYLYPGKTTPEGINGRILPEDVEENLHRDSDICAVLITSPTYDGMVSDVKAIAEIAHARDIPLIVDEAHGAHFGMHASLPVSSVSAGADYVIHSLHKTLPSLTQSALLHVNGVLADVRLTERFLGIYQTSSPSYVLMAGMDQCVRLLEEEGDRLFSGFITRLDDFYKSMEDLKVLRLVRTDDRTKILIGSGKSQLSGLAICDILRKEYGLELEMAAPAYALALTAVGDDEEGLLRLSRALHELDSLAQRQITAGGEDAPPYLGDAVKADSMTYPAGTESVDTESADTGSVDAESADIESADTGSVDAESADTESTDTESTDTESADNGSADTESADTGAADGKNCAARFSAIRQQAERIRPRQCRDPADAWDAPALAVPLEGSAGRVTADFVYLYPPGIPLLVPGESVEEELLQYLLICRENGYLLQGMADRSGGTIRVLKEPAAGNPEDYNS